MYWDEKYLFFCRRIRICNKKWDFFRFTYRTPTDYSVMQTTGGTEPVPGTCSCGNYSPNTSLAVNDPSNDYNVCVKAVKPIHKKKTIFSETL